MTNQSVNLLTQKQRNMTAWSKTKNKIKIVKWNQSRADIICTNRCPNTKKHTSTNTKVTQLKTTKFRKAKRALSSFKVVTVGD